MILILTQLRVRILHRPSYQQTSHQGLRLVISPGQIDAEISSKCERFYFSQLAFTHRRRVQSKLQQPNVPPGFGKASTHARNNRRKIKRKFATGQVSAPPTSTQNDYQFERDENDISTVIPSDDVPQELVADLAPPTASLGNKTKRMGYNKAMEGAIPPKVTFDSTTRCTSSPMTPLASTPPFVAPSERTRLPKNVFVTCVDVEWRTGQGRTQRQIARDDFEILSEKVQVAQTLDSGPNTGALVDWTVIETKWGEYERLEASTTLSKNAIVAWKV